MHTALLKTLFRLLEVSAEFSHFIIQFADDEYLSNDEQYNSLAPLGQWSHVVWRYNYTSLTMTISYNGAEVSSYPHTAFLGQDAVYIGYWLGSYFNVSMDEVRAAFELLIMNPYWSRSKCSTSLYPTLTLFCYSKHTPLRLTRSTRQMAPTASTAATAA